MYLIAVVLLSTWCSDYSIQSSACHIRLWKGHIEETVKFYMAAHVFINDSCVHMMAENIST